MKVITLDFTGAKTREDMQDVIVANIDVPEYYGRNLDALHDVLSTAYIGQEVSFKFFGIAALPFELDNYAKGMLRVFGDVAASFEDYEEEDGTVFIIDTIA